MAVRFVTACDTTDPAQPDGDVATETALAAGLVVPHEVVEPAAWSTEDRATTVVLDPPGQPVAERGDTVAVIVTGTMTVTSDSGPPQIVPLAETITLALRRSSPAITRLAIVELLAGGWSASRSGHDRAPLSRSWRSSSAACAFTLCALAGGAPALATNDPSPLATGSIPADLLVLFQQAAAASPCGVPWTLLAAVAKTESSFDATAVSSAGAQGMFQFEPATFAEYAKPTPPGGAVPPSAFDPTDAAYAAARYLCSLGVADNPTLALVAYNCGNPGPACQAASAGYAEQVLATAASYTAPGGEGVAERRAGGRRLLRRVADRHPLRLRRRHAPERVRLLRAGGLGLWAGRGGRAPGGERPVARRAPRGPE